MMGMILFDFFSLLLVFNSFEKLLKFIMMFSSSGSAELTKMKNFLKMSKFIKREITFGGIIVRNDFFVGNDFFRHFSQQTHKKTIAVRLSFGEHQFAEHAQKNENPLSFQFYHVILARIVIGFRKKIVKIRGDVLKTRRLLIAEVHRQRIEHFVAIPLPGQKLKIILPTSLRRLEKLRIIEQLATVGLLVVRVLPVNGLADEVALRLQTARDLVVRLFEKILF